MSDKKEPSTKTDESKKAGKPSGKAAELSEQQLDKAVGGGGGGTIGGPHPVGPGSGG
jgi:hypothetical protein